MALEGALEDELLRHDGLSREKGVGKEEVGLRNSSSWRSVLRVGSRDESSEPGQMKQDKKK